MMLATLCHQVRFPSTQGWITIVGVVLNTLGVFVLFFFRLETPGGFVTTSGPDSIWNLVARNLRRTPWRYLGYFLLWFGVVVQAAAQFFP